MSNEKISKEYVWTWTFYIYILSENPIIVNMGGPRGGGGGPDHHLILIYHATRIFWIHVQLI